MAEIALEILNAPAVPLQSLTGNFNRCHFCGQISDELYPAHDLSANGAEIVNERYKGSCCWRER